MIIGKVFCERKDGGAVIGTLKHEPAHNVSAVDLKLDVLLPICRRKQVGMLRCACVPEVPIDHPPYIHADLQWCKTSKLRKKLGYCWSMDDAGGNPIYQVRLDVEMILHLFGSLYLHCHEEVMPEVKEEG